MSTRGGKRRAPGAHDPKRTFVAYLACRCCGHWWPCPEVMLQQLICTWRFVCPFCSQGQKKACETWDGETRTMPVPAQLDVRVPDESPQATLALSLE